VNPPHNGHFTTSSLIIAYLFGKESLAGKAPLRA